MAKNVAQCYYNQLNVTSSYIKKTCFKANNEALYTELSVVDWDFGVVPDVWKCNYILLVEKCGSTQLNAVIKFKLENYRKYDYCILVGLYSERYKSFVTQCNPLRLYLLLLKCLVLAALANVSLKFFRLSFFAIGNVDLHFIAIDVKNLDLFE
ncbi:hypothetical protein GQX74_014874 [Glossina fuscipes]|nr:hypothetical protein GQX74_014874 [Glossina fuscipes]